jgi:hypothetical protein
MTRNGGRMVQGPTESTALDRIRTFVDLVNEVDCIKTKNVSLERATKCRSD